MWNRYLVSVILTRIEEAMTPKKRHWETGAEVKPDASMVALQGAIDCRITASERVRSRSDSIIAAFDVSNVLLRQTCLG